MKGNPARDHRSTIAVVYLAYPVADWVQTIRSFIASYQKLPAGREHTLHVVYNGFRSERDMNCASALLSALNARAIRMDGGQDITAYVIAANQITADAICFLNTYSELLAPAWLEKLALHLERPEVGLVGATGSFESWSSLGPQFPPFPNLHVRTNGFMIRRELFNSLLSGSVIREKLDAESSSISLTQQVMARGLDVLVVGRNGRGYPPRWWPASDTFRQGTQANLLIGDNQTRAYMAATWNSKRSLVESTWGEYLNRCNASDIQPRCPTR
jgi:hypothetical protein